MKLIVTLMAITIVVAACGGSSPDPTPSPTSSPAETSTTAASPTATASTAATATSTPVPTVPTMRFSSGQANTVMFTASGCTQCDGPDEYLYRHTTDADGATKSEMVFGPDHPSAAGPTPVAFSAAPDGSVIAAVGRRTSGDKPDATVEYQVLISGDAGNTWAAVHSQSEPAADDLYVEVRDVRSGDAGPRILLTSYSGEYQGDIRLREHFLIEAGATTELVAPDADDPAPRPFFLNDTGEVAWITFPQGTVLAANGSLLFEPNLTDQEKVGIAEMNRASDGRWYVSWSHRESEFATIHGTRFGIFSGDGTLKSFIEWRDASLYGKPAAPGVWLATIPDPAVADAGSGLPALFKLSDASVTVYDLPIFDTKLGRNRLLAISEVSAE